jgi:hypothetical protein
MFFPAPYSDQYPDSSLIPDPDLDISSIPDPRSRDGNQKA